MRVNLDLKTVRVWSIFILCIFLGPLNFVLYKVMYTTYGLERSYFVSQCVNIQYVMIGGIALTSAILKGEITEEMIATPHRKFIIMGLLDCFAGFLSAMGASRTSGAAQQLLNQSLIPCTMFFSWLFLNKKSTKLEITGAVVILLGAFIVIYPTFVAEKSSKFQFLSIMIYFSANIPFAASYCYKEFGFKNLFIHVLYLTQWVSIYQLLIGFLFAPFQALPGMGSENGLTFSEIYQNFISGGRCFFEIPESCQRNNSFFLLTGYCLVNFFFNTSGLYLVKYGSATMNSISYAIILPLTTLAFSFPILGIYSESFRPETLLGLTVVLFGFVLWRGQRFLSSEKEEEEEEDEAEEEIEDEVEGVGGQFDFEEGKDNLYIKNERWMHVDKARKDLNLDRESQGLECVSGGAGEYNSFAHPILGRDELRGSRNPLSSSSSSSSSSSTSSSSSSSSFTILHPYQSLPTSDSSHSYPPSPSPPPPLSSPSPAPSFSPLVPFSTYQTHLSPSHSPFHSQSSPPTSPLSSPPSSPTVSPPTSPNSIARKKHPKHNKTDSFHERAIINIVH